ncbi:MAG: gamma-glutamyl-phosphate reductase, partial [Clostridiaceae bacterium]|nr:gamma-glutamyl-phosphate reductase [Clostridiaceae bacterium]
STSKLHARGPVGLDGLVTYQYRLLGHGQIVADYASGKARFRHQPSGDAYPLQDG